MNNNTEVLGKAYETTTNNKIKHILQKILGIAIVINLLFPSFAPLSRGLISVAAEANQEIAHAVIWQELEKHIPYENQAEKGVIVQQLISTRVQYETEEIKDLPVENSEIQIKVPDYQELQPERIEVLPTKLDATNGQMQNEINSNTFTYNWDTQNKIIIINTQNPNQNIVTGQDEYYITYYYGEQAYDKYQEFITNLPSEEENQDEQSTENEENVEFNSNISCTFTLNKGTEKITATGQEETKVNLNNQIRELITVKEEITESSISKGKLYANDINQEELYNINLNTKLTLNISKINYMQGIQIENSKLNYAGEYRIETGAYLQYEEALNHITQTIFDKQSLNNIFGDQYTINIFDGEEQIQTITNQTEPNELGKIEIKYETPVNNLKMMLSEPKESGILNIENKKELLPNSELYRDQITKLDVILSNTEIKNILKDNTEISSSAITQVNLEETITNLKASISETNLNALLPNEGIEIKIELDNSKEQSDMWKNGKILIEMPEEIENLEITNQESLYQDTIEKIEANVIEYKNKKAILINRNRRTKTLHNRQHRKWNNNNSNIKHYTKRVNTKQAK